MKVVMLLVISSLFFTTLIFAGDDDAHPRFLNLKPASGTAFSPTAALGSYSLTRNTAGERIDLSQSPSPSGQAGFSPEVTIGGELEMRYFIGGTIK